MEINPHIFRAYDIRGIYPKDLNETTFRKIGFALGRKRKKYLVGNDIRKSGKSLALALISGLLAKKSKVVYGGTGSFGQILFSGLKKKADFTLFVTASHLPSKWNGLKIFKGDGEPIPPEKLKDKVLKIKEKEIKFKKPKIKTLNLGKDYINFLLKTFSDLKKAKFKIVLDCGGGSTSLVAPKIFKKLGFHLIEIFCKPDPTFSKRNPEPKPENLRRLIKTVIKRKANFGVAFDGDGDRGVIIDDKGRYLRGDQLALILAKEIFKKEKKKIVIKTVSCTMALERELGKLGTKVIEVPVGHTFVGIACKKEKAILGIEESSHLYYPKIYLFDDAILTPLFVARVLMKTGKKLSQLVDEIPIYSFKEIDFPCKDEIKFQVVERMKKKFKKRYQKINTLDGVKIYFKDSWVLIRASNTSPKIKLYVEATTKKKLSILKNKFSRILKKCIKQLS